MKKILTFFKMLSVTLTILVVVGVVWNLLFPTGTDIAIVEEASEETEETTDGDMADTAAEETSAKETKKSRGITQSDIRTQETRLEVLQKRLDEVQPKLEFYQSLPEQLSEDEIKEIAQSRVLQCYEENVVLAVEAKTLLMGGLGVPIPSEFDTANATDNYEDYLKEEITETLLGEIGSDQVKNAVKYGIDGAVDAYESEGSLSAALDGALDSIADGVTAEIQDYPYQLARGILDETTGGLYSIAEGLAASNSPEEFLEGFADEKTGGLIGTVGDIINYDRSSPAFYQNLSESASKSAEQLEAFLDKDTINSEDIANMMYQYSQFGEAMYDLNGYDWSGHYDSMQTVYDQFVRNENMIEMLSVPFTSAGRQFAENIQEKNTETQEASETEEFLQPGDEREEGKAGEYQTETEAEYQAILEQIEEKEAMLSACQQQIAAQEEVKFAILHKYREQMEGIQEEYRPLINYHVKNFEAKYDTGGSEEVQDVNQINYAIGELSKYTPWKFTANLFTSMAIDRSNADYEAMVNANAAFGTGMQTIIVDTKAVTDKFAAKLDFYEMLVADSENAGYGQYTEEKIREIWENQYLMEYALHGNDVDMEPYALEVRKQLYIMGAATRTLEDFYKTLLTDCDSKTRSIDQLEEQYQEIMDIIDPDENGQIAALVQPEEMEKYISPLIVAGMRASNGYAALGSASPLVDARFTYTTYGRVYWFYKEGLMMASGDDVHIYYAGDKPVFVNGYIFYNGTLLNGDGTEDAKALYEEAIWMGRGNIAEKAEYTVHIDQLHAACGD